MSTNGKPSMPTLASQIKSSMGDPPAKLTTEQLKAERTRLRLEQQVTRLRHSQKLLENVAITQDYFGALVDMSERYRDGSQILAPISTPNDRRYGRNFPMWQTEQELALLRMPARILCATNSSAIGLMSGLTSYVIGDGYSYRIVQNARAKSDASKELIKAAQEILDEFDDRVIWSELEAELFHRSREDGESILRHWFTDDGMTDVRTVEPEQLLQPPGSLQDDWSFGVRTAPGDVQTPLEFHLAYLNDAPYGEDVPASEVVFTKVNTKRSIKRGVTDFCFDTYDSLLIASKLRTNMGQGAAVQAAIAAVIQHEAANQQQIQNWDNGNAQGQTIDPVTGQAVNWQKFLPGSQFNVPKGMNYIAPPAASNADKHVLIFSMLLRSAGQRWNAPEWLGSADASNNNYASSLTAESPFVKTCSRWQHFYARRFRETHMIVLRNAIRAGRLPSNALELIDVKVEPSSIEARNKLQEAQQAQIEIPLGVDSRQRYAQQAGRDWEQIQQDNEQYQQETGGDGQGLPMPGAPAGAGPAAGPNLESSDPKATPDDKKKIAEAALEYLKRLLEGSDFPEDQLPSVDELVKQISAPKKITEQLLLEDAGKPGFTGTIKDKRGRELHYVDGKRVSMRFKAGGQVHKTDNKEHFLSHDQAHAGHEAGQHEIVGHDAKTAAVASDPDLTKGAPDHIAAEMRAKPGAVTKMASRLVGKATAAQAWLVSKFGVGDTAESVLGTVHDWVQSYALSAANPGVANDTGGLLSPSTTLFLAGQVLKQAGNLLAKSKKESLESLQWVIDDLLQQLIESHEPESYTQQEYDLLEAANRSHLVRKEIINKSGKKQVVYVNPNKGKAVADRKAKAHDQTSKKAYSEDVVKQALVDPSNLHPDDLKDISGHLQNLTVNQLKKLQKDHGAKGGRLKKEIVDKIAQHVQNKAQQPKTPIKDESSGEFANRVKDAIARMPKTQTTPDNDGNFFHDNKAVIKHVYAEMKKDDPSLTREEFDKKLLQANQDQHLMLTRADMVGVMHPAIGQGHIKDGNSDYHFITGDRSGPSNWGVRHNSDKSQEISSTGVDKSDVGTDNNLSDKPKPAEEKKMETKQPWEHTQKEYNDRYDAIRGLPPEERNAKDKELQAQGFIGNHRQQVTQAVKAGLPVPQSVIDEHAPAIAAQAFKKMRQVIPDTVAIEKKAATPVRVAGKTADGGLVVRAQQTGPNSFKEIPKGHVVIVDNKPMIVTKSKKVYKSRVDGMTSGYFQDVSVREPKKSEETAAKQAVYAHKLSNVNITDDYPELAKKQSAEAIALAHLATGVPVTEENYGPEIAARINSKINELSK